MLFYGSLSSIFGVGLYLHSTLTSNRGENINFEYPVLYIVYMYMYMYKMYIIHIKFTKDSLPSPSLPPL